MADPVDEFCEGASGREFDTRLETVIGTLSFDTSGGDDRGPWFVEVDRGRLNVSREPREADSVAPASRRQVNEIVTELSNAGRGGDRS